MKIIVVGAGPAGLDFSIRAARQGHDVLLIERRKDEKTSFCGEMTAPSLMPEGFARRAATESVLSHSRNIGIIFIDENYGELSRRNIPDTTSVLIDSRIFREKLRGIAEREGVSFMFNTTLKEVAVGADSVSAVVRTDGGERELRADIILGADGVNSTVRRQTVGSTLLSLPSMRKKYLITNNYPEGEFRFYLAGPFRFGYGWIYPGEKREDGQVVNIGIGYIDDYIERGMRELFDEFLEFVRKKEGFRLVELEESGALGNRIPYSGLVKPAGARRVILIGDALGTVDAVVGGGLAGAIRSSYEAARYLDGKLKEGGTDFSDWYEYISNTQMGGEIEESAKLLYIALRIYRKERGIFERLSRYVAALDEETILAVGEGNVKTRHIVRFILRHPVMALSALKRIGPFRVRRYLNEYEREREN